MKFLPHSGWAVVKGPDAHLITTAAYVSPAHKHADELSFELYESGERVIADTGKFAYGEALPFRRHVCSAAAHSVLVVDGHDEVWWRKQDPYGSAMLAAGEGEGWYAVLGTNPLIERFGVHHERLFLYRPGEALLVVDDLQAEREHDYTRIFQLAPQVKAKVAQEAAVVRGSNFRGEVRDRRGARPELVRGREDPPLGWSSPSEAEMVPATALVYASRGATEVEVAAFTLGATPLVPGRARRRGEALELTVALGDERLRLEVERDARVLAVSSRPTGLRRLFGRRKEAPAAPAEAPEPPARPAPEPVRLEVSGCPVCGHQEPGDKCPGCKARPRTRTISPVFDHLGLDRTETPVLAFGMVDTEKAQIEHVYPRFKSVSLFRQYQPEHEEGVDARDLSRYGDNEFSGHFSSCLFDYFGEQEQALAEAARVVEPGGAVITHIAAARLRDDWDGPAVLPPREGDPRKTSSAFPSAKVGRYWFLEAMERAGLRTQWIQVHDNDTGKDLDWFVGFKPESDAVAAPPA
jgi:hypothetical protein